MHTHADRVTLLNFIRDHTTGTYAHEFYRCYKGVREDINALHREHKIFIVHDLEDNVLQSRDAVFPAEMMGVQVDDDIIKAFHEVEVPLDRHALKEAVEGAGLVSAVASRFQQQAAAAGNVGGSGGKKRKATRAFNVSRLTNAHLPDMFK